MGSSEPLLECVQSVGFCQSISSVGIHLKLPTTSADSLEGEGDPSEDVAHASVIFLVDAKLVLLQSSTDEQKGLKYDMRVIANNVEYFDLMRDQLSLIRSPDQSLTPSPSATDAMEAFYFDRGLKDSLWYFDGNHVRCWMDVEDVITAASSSNDRDLPPVVTIESDFYPSSVILDKGIILGIDAELLQRRDVQFAYFRLTIRTQLFLSAILYRQLALSEESTASSLAHRYQSLPYFSHALEILLHTTLDEEVDHPPDPNQALLPRVLKFLSPFPTYLDILVQCTRKTEVRSWRTLFQYLPPPQQLFDQCLERGMLKTAGGYLIVLQTFDEAETSSEQCVRLLQRAKEEGDWELCMELARFLRALDESGDTLREAVGRMGIVIGQGKDEEGEESVRLKTPTQRRREEVVGVNGAISSASSGSGSGSWSESLLVEGSDHGHETR